MQISLLRLTQSVAPSPVLQEANHLGVKVALGLRYDFSLTPILCLSLMAIGLDCFTQRWPLSRETTSGACVRWCWAILSEV